MELQSQLKDLGEQSDFTDETQVHYLEKEIGKTWEQETEFWRQKCRKAWLIKGDKNTSFFHTKVAQRRRRNRITGVFNGRGDWCEDKEVIATEFVGYFHSLFTAEGVIHVGDVLGAVKPLVTNRMNTRLTKEVTRMEVKQALFEMDPSKAPGSDGMTAGFFQRYWDTVGEDVTGAVQQFFTTGYLLKSLNHSQIVLIPKVKTPTQVSQYRPISLCNVVYKIIAKVLANRLRIFLPSIISCTQSAFVKNRQIVDNILIAQEVIHHMKNKRTGKEGFMSLKLDIAKAYDRVEWSYLNKLM